MAVPEKEEEHDGGPLLFLRPWEMIHSEVPAMRYLVRLRIVEYQDWHSPPPSEDEDYRRDDDSDSGDSNCNGYWLGHSDRGGAGDRPRTTRFGDARDPRMQRNYDPAFQRCGSTRAITVGQVRCPVIVLTPSDSGLAEGSRIPGGMVASLIPAMAWSPVAEFVPKAAEEMGTLSIVTIDCDPRVDPAFLFVPCGQPDWAGERNATQDVDVDGLLGVEVGGGPWYATPVHTPPAIDLCDAWGRF
jgi:hypothetical protein